MHTQPILFFCFCWLIVLTSCGKYPCTKASIGYSLIGFTDAESDALILRRFNKNSSVIIDSFSFDSNNPIRFSRQSDTLRMVAFTSDALLESAYDYQLYFPVANKTFTITEITEKESFIKKSLFNNTKEGCINPVTSYVINGQKISNPGPFASIYLSK